MAYMLGRHGMFLELNEDVEDYEDLTEIMSNVQLNSNFLALAREVSELIETQLLVPLTLKQPGNFKMLIQTHLKARSFVFFAC